MGCSPVLLELLKLAITVIGTFQLGAETHYSVGEIIYHKFVEAIVEMF